MMFRSEVLSMYFDNSATSLIDLEVLEAMLPFLKEEYGNPSSKYYKYAKNAKKAVEMAREQVASLINASPESIVFTAGSTESTNFIIKGYLDYRKYYGDGRNHIVTSKVEHHATLNVCKYLNGEIYSNNDSTFSLLGGTRKVDRGFEASFVNPNQYGSVTAEAILDALQKNTAMVSVIHVNNEVGSISDVKSIAQLCSERGIACHVDATQSLGKLPIDVKDIGCDYMSCSAHKLYGPKGVGFAYLKSDAYGIEPISAFMHGGEQEGGYRAGTLAVHNIVGLGKAAEIARRDFESNRAYISKMDNYLIKQLAEIPFVSLTNSGEERLPGIISIVVNQRDFNNERFIKKVSDKVAISTGSACSAGKPSHVLEAMGLGHLTNKVIRISLSNHTNEAEIDSLIAILKQEV